VSKFERIGTNRGLKNDRDQMRRLAMVFTILAAVMLLTPVRSAPQNQKGRTVLKANLVTKVVGARDWTGRQASIIASAIFCSAAK
jgi:hypothetical protein